jgi:hypothetical protein
MPKRERFLSRKLFALICLIIFLGLAGYLCADEVLAHGQIIVRGVSLQIDPANQSVPVNTPTIVNTIFSAGSGPVVPGMILKGELRGPGISGAIALSTLPGHPFAIPGFPYKGTYTLADIRLENNGKVLLRSTPDSAVIDVSDIVVTQVQTRPLTLAEIREKGIVITQENFTVYNFSVGLLVASKPVQLNFPVIFTPQGVEFVGGGFGGGADGVGGDDSSGMTGFLIEPDIPKMPGEKIELGGKSIPGILVFNNKIGFLNQFFSAMFIISNNAPAGSPLAIKDLKATLVLPDGLREAKTNPPHISGTPIPVRCPGPDGKIGTADDVDIILATFNFQRQGRVPGRRTYRGHPHHQN